MLSALTSLTFFSKLNMEGVLDTLGEDTIVSKDLVDDVSIAPSLYISVYFITRIVCRHLAQKSLNHSVRHIRYF